LNRKLIYIAILLVAAGLSQTGLLQDAGSSRSAQAPPTEAASFVAGAQVHGSGVVTRILADDLEGSRHQRFILRMQDGRTLLIAHNIDVAPRIPSLLEGDSVEFYGVFETNDRGGVIHWTHHDPAGRHVDGWLKHAGKKYQ
jgi:Protein of unknown function (DUF3465)